MILPKPKIREADFLSPETDLDLRIEDYYDRLLGESASEEVWAALEAFKLDTLRQLVSKGLLTEGQMVFFCSEYFRAEVLNGGFLQFLGNSSFLTGDVIHSLSQLGLNDLAQDVAALTKKLMPFVIEQRELPGDTRNGAFRSANRSIEAKMKDALVNSLEGQRIERGFSMVWSEQEKTLVWNEDQYAPTLVNAMLAFVESNRREFVQSDAL